MLSDKVGKIAEIDNEVLDFRNTSGCKSMIMLSNFRMEFNMAGDKTLCNVPPTAALQFYNVLQHERYLLWHQTQG